MSILSEEIVIHKGDLYENILVVVGVMGLEWSSIEKLVKYAIKNCPLDKWPEWAEECVKSHLNAQNRIVITEQPHPFISNQVQIDFSCDGGVIFTAYCTKKEGDSEKESPTRLYKRYIIPMPTGYTQQQDLQEGKV